MSTEPSGVSRIRYFPHFIEQEDCEWMYDRLFHELPWKQRSDYVNREKERVQPRLTAWFGEHPYAYSGQMLDAYTEVRSRLHGFLVEFLEDFKELEQCSPE